MEEVNLIGESDENVLDLVDKPNESSDESTLNESNEETRQVENLTEAVENLIENNLNIGHEEEEEVEGTENIGAEDNDDVEELVNREGEEATSGAGGAANPKQIQLALSRIKTIMKLDPDLSLTSKESVFMIAKATELFIDFLSKESYKFTSQGSRKTIQRKDIDQAINSVDSLCFLDAALD